MSIPLPGSLEAAAAEAAQSREHVLLVGADPALCERVARRIHELTPSNRRRPKCVSLSREEVSGRAGAERLRRWLSACDTIYLQEAESVSGEAAMVLHKADDARARLVFSTTTDPGRWPTEGPEAQGTRGYVWRLLLDCRRIDVYAGAGDALAGARPEKAEPDQAPGNVFRLAAEVMELTYASKSVTLPGLPPSGFRAIAYLLSLPDGRPRGGAADVRAAKDGGESPQLSEARQEVADEQTLAAVRGRLRGIDVELDAEDVTLSIERREELAEEREKLRVYLAGAEGLGGRGRPLGSRDDGQAVGQAIRRALKQIEKAHPDLHAHLNASLKDRYGVEVRYEPAEPATWDVRM